MAQPKGHQPQHSTDHHVAPKVRATRSSSKMRSNASAAKGSGLKTKGGTGMSGKHC